MASNLSEEQKKRIEENRQKALAIRAEKNRQKALQIRAQKTAASNSSCSAGSSISHRIESTSSAASSHPYTKSKPDSLSPHHKTIAINASSYPFSYTHKQSSANTSRDTSKKAFMSMFNQPVPATHTKTSSTKTNHVTTTAFYADTTSQSTSTSVHSTSTTATTSQNSSSAGADSKTVPGHHALKGHCVLKTKDRFTVVIGYSAKVIDIFKSIPSRVYDRDTKLWSFALRDHEKLCNELNTLGSSIKIERIPHYVTSTISKHSHDVIPSADLSGVEEKLASALMPFQREGVDYAIFQHGRLMFADDMGLGKTLQALCVADYYRDEWPVLVICPSSVRYAWKEQCLRWLPRLLEHDIAVLTTGQDSCHGASVVIVSYDLMTRQVNKLKQYRYRVVIADESHFMKNHKAARTKAALELLKLASRVLMLSGTPALSRPMELYPQISAIDGKLFPKFVDYGVRYCDGRKGVFGWDFNGSSNLEELEVLLSHIMIRRLKKDVLSQLPSKTREICILDPATVKIGNELKKSCKLLNQLKGQDQKNFLFELFHKTCSAKTTAVIQYVADLLEAGEKLLIFAHHRLMLDALEAYVTKHNIGYVRIDGSVGPERRNCCVKTFQNDDNVKAAILSITAANAGLNLTAAKCVVFAELYWNPGILQQAEDRAHRLGQQESVTIKYLIANHTADDHIWPLIQEKLEVLGKAGLSKDDFSVADTTHVAATSSKSKHKDITGYFEVLISEEMDRNKQTQNNDCAGSTEGAGNTEDTGGLDVNDTKLLDDLTEDWDSFSDGDDESMESVAKRRRVDNETTVV